MVRCLPSRRWLQLQDKYHQTNRLRLVLLYDISKHERYGEMSKVIIVIVEASTVSRTEIDDCIVFCTVIEGSCYNFL
jgi:hypothetical protein